MSRRHLAFACGTDILAGTLDEAPGAAGVLLVTGGNEVRAGAFGGQAALARRLAAAGHPVLRFDRRGTGDSTGANLGFRGSAPDIAAALAAFRQQVPHLRRVIGFGNCDAASALMLAGGAGCDALVLANPWTIEQDDGALAPSAIRERYTARLRDPRALLRLATGQVSFLKLAGGVARLLRPAPPPPALARELEQGLASFRGPVRILLAERDRTAQAFLAAWRSDDPRIARCLGASHAFVESEAREWLLRQILTELG